MRKKFRRQVESLNLAALPLAEFFSQGAARSEQRGSKACKVTVVN